MPSKVTVKVNAKPKPKQKEKKPVKAGSLMPKNIGGAVNAKLVATVRRRRKKK